MPAQASAAVRAWPMVPPRCSWSGPASPTGLLGSPSGIRSPPPPPPRSRWDGPVFQQPSFWELLCVTIVANSAGALREVPLLLPEGG